MVASRLVLREADRNFRRKAQRGALREFHAWLEATKILIVPTPHDDVLSRYEAAIHPKDVPVLAAAIEAHVDYLVTLDRQHFLTTVVQARAGDTQVMTPGEFLKLVVPRLSHRF